MTEDEYIDEVEEEIRESLKGVAQTIRNAIIVMFLEGYADWTGPGHPMNCKFETNSQALSRWVDRL